MPSFFRKLFGGGSRPSQPAPRPAPKPQAKAADPGIAAGLKARTGRSRNKTVYTDALGVSPEAKSELNRKYVTGA